MRTDDLDFNLPSELIAQAPAESRAQSRLLHYQRVDRSMRHRQFAELPALLRAGDLLVFNDARVVPARFTLQKDTGGLVEGMFVAEAGAGRWRVLLKNIGGGWADKRVHFLDAPEVRAGGGQGRGGGVCDGGGIG